MKKFLTLLCLVVGLAAAAPKALEAHAGFYIGPLGGANFLQTNSKHNDFDFDFDVGYYVGGFVGYEFCNGLAVEGEFTYRNNQIKSFKFLCEHFDAHGTFWSMSYMANVIYNISLSRFICLPITPYVGAGVGYANQNLKLKCFDDQKKNGFAWQVIGGIGYDITPCFSVAVDYRFNEGRSTHIYNHSIGVAADYHF